MRFLLLMFFVFVYTSAYCASESGTPCELLTGQSKPNPKICICSESLSKLPITAPPGFSLVSACNYEEYEGDVLGNYAFRGKAVISGVISRVANEDVGPILSFTADEKIPFNRFGSAMSSLRFSNDEQASTIFKIPKLTQKSPCWNAHVTINVTLLNVSVGYGTDDEGSFPEEFEVLHIGNYTPCGL